MAGADPNFGVFGCLNPRAPRIPRNPEPCRWARPAPMAGDAWAAPAWLPAYTREAGLYHPFNSPGTAPVQTRCKTALLACSRLFPGPGTHTATCPCSLDMGDTPPPPPCPHHSLLCFSRGEEEVVCSCAHSGRIPEPTPCPGKETGASPRHCGFGGDRELIP